MPTRTTRGAFVSPAAPSASAAVAGAAVAMPSARKRVASAAVLHLRIPRLFTNQLNFQQWVHVLASGHGTRIRIRPTSRDATRTVTYSPRLTVNSGPLPVPVRKK